MQEISWSDKRLSDFQGESNSCDYPCVIVSHFEGSVIYNVENQRVCFRLGGVWKLPRAVRQYKMVVSSVRLGTEKHCAREGQQQFSSQIMPYEDSFNCWRTTEHEFFLGPPEETKTAFKRDISCIVWKRIIWYYSLGFLSSVRTQTQCEIWDSRGNDSYKSKSMKQAKLFVLDSILDPEDGSSMFLRKSETSTWLYGIYPRIWYSRNAEGVSFVCNNSLMGMTNICRYLRAE
jgi:hypothetical protein